MARRGARKGGHGVGGRRGGPPNPLWIELVVLNLTGWESSTPGHATRAETLVRVIVGMGHGGDDIRASWHGKGREVRWQYRVHPRAIFDRLDGDRARRVGAPEAGEAADSHAAALSRRFDDEPLSEGAAAREDERGLRARLRGVGGAAGFGRSVLVGRLGGERVLAGADDGLVADVQESRRAEQE